MLKMTANKTSQKTFFGKMFVAIWSEFEPELRQIFGGGVTKIQ